MEELTQPDPSADRQTAGRETGEEGGDLQQEEADAANNGLMEEDLEKMDLDEDAPKSYNPDRRRGSVGAKLDIHRSMP